MRYNPRNARKHTKKSPKNNEQGKDQVLDKASEVKNEELQEEGEGEGKTGNSVERAQVDKEKKKEHITKPTSYRCDSCGKVFKTEGMLLSYILLYFMCLTQFLCFFYSLVVWILTWSFRRRLFLSHRKESLYRDEA